MRSSRFLAADLFCGAGGTSTGLVSACEASGRKLDLVAVNHWPVAVETHSLNHPNARHFCEPVDAIDPRKAVPEGRLDLLWASPECTHHSNARGGKPVNDQSRASAWCVLRWATALRVDNILIENVPEFQSWGPLGSDGKPLKSRQGETFRAFLDSLRSLGYRTDWMVLTAADYGDPTTRQRLFIQARRGRRQITWPRQTHSAMGEPTFFGQTLPWRSAREIINWSHKGTSIFGRKRPLSPNTIARIAAGLRKFGGKGAEPFLVMLNGTSAQKINGSVRSVSDPVPTITAGGEHVGLCEPFLVSAGGPKVDARPVSQPANTVLTRDHMALVEPFIIPANYGERPGQAPRCHDVNDPMPTVVGTQTHALVEPFLLTVNHGQDHNCQRRAHSVERPVPTLTSGGRSLAVCDPVIVPVNHGADRRAYSIDRPMPTITTVDAWALAEPFLVKYNGTAKVISVQEPLDTVTAKDRFGLCQPVTLDILFRMLTPSELASAMSFPDGYRFAGNREKIVKQIGNAVPVKQAEALCAVLMAG